MKKIRFPLNPLQPFQSGNVWELKDSFLRIGDVGKLLVHYRHYKGQDPRGPLSITGKRDLAKYLIHSKAVLVQK